MRQLPPQGKGRANHWGQDMSETIDTLTNMLEGAGLGSPPELKIHHNPSGLPFAWMTLTSPADIRPLSQALKAIGGRLATMTVFRPDPELRPGVYQIVYHVILSELPVSIMLDLAEDVPLPSITSLFPNADWEERELMELSGVEVIGHPDPRRLFLDESIDAGVLGRMVPYSEMTNVAEQDAVWQRIYEESCAARKRRQERQDKNNEATP